MERLILDTGMIIAAERGALPAGAVFTADADLAVCAITAAELLLGVELADDSRRDRRARIAEGVFRRTEVLPFDLSAARHHAELAAFTRRDGTPRANHDLLIAATARATGRTVITTDARAFGTLPAVMFRLVTSM